MNFYKWFRISAIMLNGVFYKGGLPHEVKFTKMSVEVSIFTNKYLKWRNNTKFLKSVKRVIAIIIFILSWVIF